jgi:hypothetical protein
VGLSESALKRMEAGKGAHPHSIKRVAAYYRRSPEALGLLPRGRVEAVPAPPALSAEPRE